VITDKTLSESKLSAIAAALWRLLSGEDILWGNTAFDSTLEGFITYLAKHPIAGPKTGASLNQLNCWRSAIDSLLLSEVEREGVDPLRRWATGIFKGTVFRKAELRGRLQRSSRSDLRSIIALRNLPPFPPGVHDVLEWRACPQCRARVNNLRRHGRDRRGEQRHQCRCCKKTCTSCGLPPLKPRVVPGTRVTLKQGKRMWYAYKRCSNVALVAHDVAHFDRRTVSKVIVHFNNLAKRYAALNCAPTINNPDLERFAPPPSAF
jgi:hypothetical protein